MGRPRVRDLLFPLFCERLQELTFARSQFGRRSLQRCNLEFKDQEDNSAARSSLPASGSKRQSAGTRLSALPTLHWAQKLQAALWGQRGGTRKVAHLTNSHHKNVLPHFSPRFDASRNVRAMALRCAPRPVLWKRHGCIRSSSADALTSVLRSDFLKVTPKL